MNTLKVGVVVAMQQEFSALQARISNYNIIRLPMCEICTGKFENIDLVLLKSGIGKVQSSIGAFIMIEKYNPNYIINVGCSGGINPSIEIGDIVIPSKVCYHDVDITSFGYEIGQLPNCPAFFKTDFFLSSIIEESTKKLKYRIHKGLLISGDTFIEHHKLQNKINLNFPLAIAADMESAAIAHVCYKLNISYTTVKVISDLVCAKNSDPLIFNKNLDMVGERLFLILKNTLLLL